MFTLTLTAEQAEILGFALAKAKAGQHDALNTADKRFQRDGIHDRIRRIEEVQWLLDAAPETAEPPADIKDAVLNSTQTEIIY